jgi:diguanylate cyclase (GGDEF)-like protein
LVAQNETIGLFHLIAPQSSPAISDSRALLAETFANRLALTLSNLRLQNVLHEQAVRDQLTGLFNRRYFEETLEREFLRAQRGDHPLAMLMLDLDHLKNINDTLGHEAGDAALIALGAVLKNQTRGSDVACRYGGDEFMIILNETTRDDARKRAEQIHHAVRQLDTRYAGTPIGALSVSIGVASFPENGMDTAALLRAADAALYRAKADGRNRVAIAE